MPQDHSRVIFSAPAPGPGPGSGGGLPRRLDPMAVGRSIVGPSMAPEEPEVEGYEILRFIARGGSAQVWAATRLADEHPVALKVAFDEDPENAERLLLEAETTHSLRHPHIVRMLDQTVTRDDRPVLVMELVDGPALSARLPDGGFTLGEALAIFLPVLEAVEHAHGRGIIHRDLKPANILLTPGGMPKVSDFGLARPVKDRLVAFSLTHTGAVAGTVEYLPPESYLPGYEPDRAADIYALGILLYEMLTGMPPRGAWSPLSSVKQLDVRLDVLIADAISPDPAKRLASADLFRQRLHAIRDSAPRLAGTPLLTRPVRVADAFWTVAGLYFMAAGFCTMERINNTDVPAVFDLTFQHTPLLGGFWATWVLGTGVGIMWFWQLIRLWIFRRVPFSERLPAPFGLKMEPSRGSRFFTGIMQILCGWLPALFGIFIATDSWHWLNASTPPWDSALVITPWDSVGTASMWQWDPPAFLDGGSYWIKEVQPDLSPGKLKVRDRQSFLVFTQPLTLTLGLAAIALGMAATLASLAAAWWPRRKVMVGLMLGFTAWFVTSIRADVLGTRQEKEQYRRDTTLLETIRSQAAEREVTPWMERLFNELYLHPDPACPLPPMLENAFRPTVITNDTDPARDPSPNTSDTELPRDNFRRNLATRQNREIQNRRQTSPARYDTRVIDGKHFRHRIAFERWMDPPQGPSTGDIVELRLRAKLPFANPPGIYYWNTRTESLYSADARELEGPEAVAWVESWLQCLGTPGCPGLETFLLKKVFREDSDPNTPLPSPAVCEVLRSRPLPGLKLQGTPGLKRLPGARWQLLLSLATANPPEQLRWRVEIVHTEDRWQILRLAF